MIARVYECILKDACLGKYFPDKERAQPKLLFTVKSVFLNGLSRNLRTRMQQVHTGMGITDSEFDLYLRYFTEAMSSQGVRAEHVAQSREFLESFRADVVQRLLCQT